MKAQNVSALHAAYSQRLSHQHLEKAIIKMAKDNGLESPEVWRHEGQWAMRYIRNGQVRFALGSAKNLMSIRGATKKQTTSLASGQQSLVAALKKRIGKRVIVRGKTRGTLKSVSPMDTRDAVVMIKTPFGGDKKIAIQDLSQVKLDKAAMSLAGSSRVSPGDVLDFKLQPGGKYWTVINRRTKKRIGDAPIRTGSPERYARAAGGAKVGKVQWPDDSAYIPQNEWLKKRAQRGMSLAAKPKTTGDKLLDKMIQSGQRGSEIMDYVTRNRPIRESKWDRLYDKYGDATDAASKMKLVKALGVKMKALSFSQRRATSRTAKW